ncbi:MAG: ABC transporter ATP-binding protein [Silvibacterium sp.]|nr:ABC transporter ATP-binding protein [Silvibacterium sp.]
MTQLADQTAPPAASRPTETKVLERPAPRRSRREQLRNVMPEIWSIVKPRKWLLLFGLILLLINRASGLVLPLSTKWLIDKVMVGRQGYLLLPLVGGVLLATAIQAITAFALQQSLSKSAWALITDLRIQIQAHIGRLPIAFYDANRTGVLVSRIMADVEGVRNLMGTGLMEFLGGSLTALMSLGVLLSISARMTVIAALIMLGFTLALRKVFGTIRPIYHERAKIYGDVTGRLTESLGGIRVVKGYRAEARESAVFAAGVRRLLANIMRSITAISFMSVSSTVVVGLIGALVMFLGTREYLGHKLTIGQYGAYAVFLAYLIAPAFQVVSVGTQLTEAIAGLDRTRELLAEAEEDDDPRRTCQIPDGKLTGEVRFDDVHFAYHADKPVLRGISFVAPPGTVTALVGPSGSGKSTIISLITAFHNPDTGKILLDGIDLTTVELGSYRTHLGVVLQESFLFDGTIRDNVAFSRPDATEEEILEAARIARVDEFATRFPEGYDTIVGERGVKLSGGQRQRISIARAILANPRILILDEATSSLDSESEALIQEGLSYLMRGRTTFVIAHRLSTIRRADQILVVDNGLVQERGTHAELLAARGQYYDLYTRQYAFESNLFLAPGEGDTQPEEEHEAAAGLRAPSLSQALRGRLN